MSKDIHKTLTDPEGNSYRIYPSWWIKWLTGIASINFIVLVLIIAWLIDNTQTIQSTLDYTEKGRQRNLAIQDFAEGRLKANMWTYEKVCEMAKKLNEPCLDSPKWYADPTKYPLIANDPMGAGLFPPK